MKRKVIMRILAVIMSCSMFPITMGSADAITTASAENKTAVKTTAAVYVESRPRTLNAYNIDGNNYFKLRDIAYLLNGTGKQFNVEWNGAEKTIYLTAGQSYSEAGGELSAVYSGAKKNAVSANAEVYLDGKAISFTAYTIDGNNYFKLRDLGAYLDFGVVWNDNNKSIEISSQNGYAPEGEIVIGMHTAVYDDETAQMLVDSLQSLADQGINLLIVEVGYSYQYTSHPELASEYGLSFESARAITKKSKELGIEIVPEINCLGHQSWEEYTDTLLSVYPELDETIGQYPNNEGIYCRSWCPLNEKVDPIVFDLIDELMEAFQSDAFHVGMDEVFIIGDQNCPRCRGKSKGELFAKEVNSLYQHIVTEKGATMYLWSDRLLDGKALGDVYSEWDASYNGTFEALDKIPKDIIMCDWHYDVLDDYPSITYLTEAGFRVLTASYNNVEAAENFVQSTIKYRKTNANVLGHLYTTWEDIENIDLPNWKPMTTTVEMLKAER